MTVASYKFEAHNSALNLNRYYEIDVARDLFGDWVIMTYYGRISYKGQKRQYGYSSFDSMSKKLSEILRKRLHAQSRIGCNYSLVYFNAYESTQELKAIVDNAYLKKRSQRSH